MIDLRKVDHIKTFGASMCPFLHDGDVIYYKKVEYQNLQVNDIIIVQKSGQYITHRIIYKITDYIVTKGDNTLKADPPVKRDEIVGLIFQVNRNDKVMNIENLYLIQSTYYLNEAILFNNLLNKQHINFVFLKGLPLHLYYEGKHPRRIYADCDLLISKKDFHKAIKLFESNGYTHTKNSLFKEKTNRNFISEISFYKTIHGFPVVFDLHIEPAFLMTQIDVTDIFYSRNLLDEMSEEFLRNKREIRVENNRFPVLSSEDMIFYLALHFFHHNYQGIFRLNFINTIIRKEKKIRWDDIEKNAEDFKVKNYVAPAFSLLKKYFDTPIPVDLTTSKRNIFSKLIYNALMRESIFDDEGRIEAGIKRLLLILIK